MYIMCVQFEYQHEWCNCVCVLLSLWLAKCSERWTRNVFGDFLNDLLRSCENECIGYGHCSNANQPATAAIEIYWRLGNVRSEVNRAYLIVSYHKVSKPKHILATHANSKTSRFNSKRMEFEYSMLTEPNQVKSHYCILKRMYREIKLEKRMHSRCKHIRDQ